MAQKKVTAKTKKRASKATKKPVPTRAKRKSQGDVSPEIRFDYIKSNAFRVIRVDGVHGGLSPKGNAIQLALFNERNPIPLEEVCQIDKNQLGKVISRKLRQAIVREVEVEALMDLETARAVSEWLKEKIKMMEKVKKGNK